MKTMTIAGAVRSVPSTIDDWQLYHLPGAGKAARALTEALAKALRHAQTGPRNLTVEAYSESLYRDHVRPVASKFAEFGAADTESRQVALSHLDAAQRRH